jgi:ATP-dependent Lhr-like helicase
MTPRGRGAGAGLSRRRPSGATAEGRWTLIEDPTGTAGTGLLAWVDALLGRYGVVCRETAALDPWAPPWRELMPVLNGLELRGRVRRGFLVEGLSGVQYADEETAESLPRLAATKEKPPLSLLSTLDPANLYGSGAPLDIALLEGGTARLPRSSSSWIVQSAGRPVLIVEGHGRRLTGLDSASEEELRSAVALLPTLAGPSRRILRVETYNLAPAIGSPAAPWLIAAGFVRDLNALSYYASGGW